MAFWISCSIGASYRGNGICDFCCCPLGSNHFIGIRNHPYHCFCCCHYDLGGIVCAVEKLVSRFFRSSLDIKKYFFSIGLCCCDYGVVFVATQKQQQWFKKISCLTFYFHSSWCFCYDSIFYWPSF